MKKVIALIVIFISSAGFIAVSYWSIKKNYRQANSFVRLFPPHLAEKLNSLDLKYNSFYFAGSSSSNLYLANTSVPSLLLTCNFNFNDTTFTTLKVDSSSAHRIRSSQLFVDSPTYYILDGTGANILKGNINNNTPVQLVNSIYFLDGVVLPGNLFVVRSLDKNQHAYFAKISPDSLQSRTNKNLITMQGDGLFSTDGMLRYDQQLNQLIYLYYYRNQYVVADTNLNLLNYGKLIDTNTIAKIELGKINTGKTSTMSAPPLLVNKNSCTYNDFLFVYSGLKADNENEKDFIKNTVIDVYDLKAGTYCFSFYLPRLNNAGPVSFLVNKDLLALLYDHDLQTYKLEDRYFKRFTGKSLLTQ